jgi:hypothetical protein
VAGVLDLDLMLKMWVALVRVRRKIGLIEAPQEYVLWLDAIYRPKERAYLKMIAEVLNSQGFGHNGQFWYNSTVWYVVHYEPDNGGKYLPCNARLAARERLEREPKLTVLRQVLGE